MKHESSLRVWYEHVHNTHFRDISVEMKLHLREIIKWCVRRRYLRGGKDSRDRPGSGWQLLDAAKKLSILRDQAQFFRLSGAFV